MTDTSKKAYQQWLEKELLPNQVPPGYLEWVRLQLGPNCLKAVWFTGEESAEVVANRVQARLEERDE